jgi:uroporphyrin-III C-methyltransferase
MSATPIAAPYPTPTGSSSLLLSFTPRTRNSSILIIGSGRLAASRAFLALDADAGVVVAGEGGIDQASEEIRYRVEKGEVGWMDCPQKDIVEEWQEVSFAFHITSRKPGCQSKGWV